MNTSNYIAVTADDLTGANDTSLQFFMKGASVQVSSGDDISIDESLNTEVFAVSSETRNSDAETAEEKVSKICENIIKKYSFDYVYKKIDSVLRGNIAVEIMTMLNLLKYDAAVIFPAFPDEGRTTIGGFQLLNGIPVQRTEVSRDPKCPITESNILNVLKNRLPDDKADAIGLIPLDIVMKGAGPILVKLNELISKGKKFIVTDAASNSDLEQTALAVSKSGYKILPAGSAGAARALGSIWHPDLQEEKNNSEALKEPVPKLFKLPKLIISGSASDLTALQIKKLQKSHEFNNIYFYPIKAENIFSNNTEDFSKKVLDNLVNENTVVVHTSELTQNKEELQKLLMEKEISKETFISNICGYLASVAQKVISQKNAVLITAGGETSYKCLSALGIKNIRITDIAAPSIPLGTDNKGRYIVTKSGNLGTPDTLIKILKYFEKQDYKEGFMPDEAV